MEINFKFNYDGEDESPVKLDLGVSGKADSTPKQNDQSNVRKMSAGSKIDIYEKDSIIFIEPMFIIDTKKF